MTFDHDTLFKVLDGTTSPVAGYRYPIGEWTEHLDTAKLQPCKVGYHLARGASVLLHLGSALYTAEPCPEHGLVEAGGQLLTCQTRLTEVDTWNERTARLFAADCAEVVLLSEEACGTGTDERSWAAVATARRHAGGLIGDDELAAAEDASWGFVGYSAWVASRSLRANAWTAAGLTVRSVVAAAAARFATAVPGRATWDVAGDARYAARAAMFDRLLMYLNGSELPPVEPLYGPAMEVSAR